MELRHLKLVKAVAETRSLTKASSLLYLSQSALSHQLKEAEEHYKTNLFSRVGKKMILTASGECLLESATKIMAELEKSEINIRSIAGGNNGTLRLSTACYTSYYWLSPFLKVYAKKFPKVDINIIAEATRKPIGFLEEGKLDIAFVSANQKIMGIEYYKIFSDELVAIVPKNHHLAKAKYLTPENFKNETVIIYTIQDEESTLINSILKPAGVYPRKVLRIELTEAIVEMVKAGLGISMLAKWAIKPYTSSNEFVVLPIGRHGFKRDWFAATLKQKQPEYVSAFIQMFRGYKAIK